MIIVGIDNGVSGGLAAIGDDLLVLLPMPTLQARKGNEIDAAAVDAWLVDVAPRLVVIEEPGGSKSAKAATSMAGSFHTLRTICVLRKIPYDRITPQAWQKVMLPGCKPGDTKRRALEVARRLWPSRDWRATPRCTTPHDGLIDATLIAEWARRGGLAQPVTN
jgi:hypothetical protein